MSIFSKTAYFIKISNLNIEIIRGKDKGTVVPVL
jgi:hypothetical protein